MAIGEFTKQIAQQAILSATTKEATPASAPAQENVAAAFFAQIHAMQKALKEDEELLVLYQAGGERIRVREIFAPSASVVVLTGTDGERGMSRVIAAVDSLQLVIKVTKVPAGAKAGRVALITPKQ